MSQTWDGNAASNSPSAGPRRLLLALLCLVTLVAAGFVIWFAAQGRGQDDPVQADRDAVMSQGRQFLLRIGTYGPDQLEENGQLGEYRQLVSEVITPKFKADFEKSASIPEQLVTQVGASRQAQVFSVGVSALDADSAEVLVAGAFTDSFEVKGKPQEQDPVPIRYQLSMKQIDGDWLVDDFSPVSAQSGDAPAPDPLAPSSGGAP